ncbi:MAG: sulfite exporter TauE/SafE family protein [Deltaproteobacteria bacterium]
MFTLGSILIGLAGGLASGFFGIGGGLVMVPAMVYLFQLTQHQAQGTSLAVLTAPVVILGAMKYYREGNSNVQMALLIAPSFIVGAYIGATLVHQLSDPTLKKIFGFVLLFVSIRMILGR